MFEYEHTSKFNVSAEMRAQLIKEIEGDEFHLSPLSGKIMLNDVEKIIEDNQGKNITVVEDQFNKLYGTVAPETIHEMFRDLEDFIYTDPKLPDEDKNYIKTVVPDISVEDSRDTITRSVLDNADKSELSLLTLYVYRQMDMIDWLPFIKAAIERNPVCFNDLKGKTISEVYEILNGMSDQSIYDGQRLALPDEVWNFRCGDGIEKALLMADLIISRDNKAEVLIDINHNEVVLKYNNQHFNFASLKSFKKSICISDNSFEIK
jgi:hypothetical protein